MVSLGLIKPLDQETVLQSATKTGRVLIVQDEPPYGGYALYLRSLLDKLPSGRLKVAPRIIHGAEQFLPYYDETSFLPSVANVVAAAKELIQITVRMALCRMAGIVGNFMVYQTVNERVQ